MTDTDIERLLVGRDAEPMVAFGDEGCLVHRDAVGALTELQEAAAAGGFQLAVASGYRGFDSQLRIWNGKARGERPLLDASERLLRAEELSADQRVFAILRWSALPGASRHHWGSDIDVFDRAALPHGSPQLRRDETVPGAVFGRFHQWLDRHLHRFGFFRPYDEDRGGVSPEPWHLSHAGLSRSFQAACSIELLERVIREAQLELKEPVLRHLDTIYRRYVMNVAPTPQGTSGAPSHST